MARNKYIADYRLNEHFDEKGRVHTDYEYIGPHYEYVLPWEEVRSAYRRAAVTAGIAWISYLAVLLPKTSLMHKAQYSLLISLSAVPLFMLCNLLTFARQGKEKLEHRHADRMENRYPALAAVMAAMCIAAVAAGAVTLALPSGRSSLVWGDAVAMTGTAVMAVCAVFLFRMRKSFLMKELSDEKLSDEKLSDEKNK